MSRSRRAVIVGPSCSGKSYLATKLAEFSLLSQVRSQHTNSLYKAVTVRLLNLNSNMLQGGELSPGSVAQLSTDTVTAQECSDLVSSCRHPTVLVLDNIHAQGSKIMQILARSVEDCIKKVT